MNEKTALNKLRKLIEKKETALEQKEGNKVLIIISQQINLLYKLEQKQKIKLFHYITCLNFQIDKINQQ